MEAALEVLGSTAKDNHPIAFGDNPFVRYLQIGKYKEGYWSSAHMAIQFENVIDCCVALYGETYDFLFLFDHSCGHDRKPTGALDAKVLNVGYGGSQPTLNPSLIVQATGYLGNHLGDDPGHLRPGAVQAFQYSDTDIGPHYLTEAQRLQKKYDMPTGRLLSKNKTKKELSRELLARGLVEPNNVPNGLAELQQRATQHDINLKKDVAEVSEGWVGKPKGLSQITWERGFWYPLETYTKARLVEFLADCTDFENAETNLQMIARTLGVQAERSPKFHCEIAGEGIEYDWAHCKQKYRKRPLTDKKTRDNFLALVKEVTSWFCATPTARRSSARARSYISGYYNIHCNNASLLRANEEVLTENGLVAEVINVEDEDAVGRGGTATEPWKPAVGEVISMDIIEKAKKQYHSHRGVNSFEKGTYDG